MHKSLRVAVLGLGLLTAGFSQAKAGCLSGAMAGGLAGHFLGRHPILGAIGGCIVGHHMANVAREQGHQSPTYGEEGQNGQDRQTGGLVQVRNPFGALE
jgi:hypothetical protein